MKIALKVFFTIVLILVLTAVLFAGFSILFKALDWFSAVTDWCKTAVYDKLGLEFYGKL